MAREMSFWRVLVTVFTGTLAVQVFAFLRQIVIASAFGVDRAMDIYVMVFAVATIAAFALSGIIENAAVPMLVGRLEAKDEDAFRLVATRIVLLGVSVGVLCCVAFAIGVPVFAYGVAWGLSAEDKRQMLEIAPWFLPWVFLAAPFYALGSILKAEQRFRRFMLAEIAVTVVSMAVLLVWRPHVGAIATAYGVGYGVGLLVMLHAVSPNLVGGAWRAGASFGIRRQLWRLFTANQVGSLNVAADRFLQSFLPAGAIAASSYATLIAGQASALLGFRDAFMGPLSKTQGKTGKLERILIGLAMLSVPAAMFISWHAQAIVSVLLERGRFDRSASVLAGLILQYMAWGVIPSALNLPMFRLLQILDRMRFTAYVLLAGVIFNLAFGVLLVFALKLGVVGYVWAMLLAAVCTITVTGTLLSKAGVTPNWLRIGGYALYALAASIAAALATRLAPDSGHAFVDLAKSTLVFCVVVAAAYGAIFQRLRAIAQDVGAT